MERRSTRTIAVVTGSRAEFGLLVPVIDAIKQSRGLRVRLVVTGTHLTTGTWREIDHLYKIDARVAMQKKGRVGRAEDVEALGRGIVGLGKVFARLRPDVVLVLGDRIEALAAACAASVGGFRLGHIHGGDRAEGVADEAMRHAISKMAHLYFAATALSRKRLIRMGEAAGVVFNTGSPAVDGIKKIKPVKVPRPFGILIQHPIGAPSAIEERWMSQTLHAANSLLKGNLLPIGPNADPGSDGIRQALRRFWKKTPGGDNFHLARHDFLSWLKASDVIVGNSSAGLIEAAVLGTPCVNIGPRQNGREKPANVIDCDYGEANVRRAIQKALKLDLRKMKHPYGDGRAGERIAGILAGVDFEKIPVRKRNSY